MSACRAVFLDRDGVLNKVIYKKGKSCPPEDAAALELVPDAFEAVKRLQASGYLCICVTNQPDIARGTRTIENVAAMNDKVCSALGLDDIYMCPHDTPDNCSCRKPKSGMLLVAAAKWNVDLGKSWMIGDRPTDMQAGRAVGCRGILIHQDHNSDAEYVCGTMTEATTYIITHA